MEESTLIIGSQARVSQGSYGMENFAVLIGAVILSTERATMARLLKEDSLHTPMEAEVVKM